MVCEFVSVCLFFHNISLHIINTHTHNNDLTSTFVVCKYICLFDIININNFHNNKKTNIKHYEMYYRCNWWLFCFCPCNNTHLFKGIHSIPSELKNINTKYVVFFCECMSGVCVCVCLRITRILITNFFF